MLFSFPLKGKYLGIGFENVTENKTMKSKINSSANFKNNVMNKTKMYACLFLLFLGATILKSQNNNNLIVFSETGDRFYLVLNGLKYNQTPETNVKVTSLNATNYKAKIIFENGHP